MRREGRFGMKHTLRRRLVAISLAAVAAITVLGGTALAGHIGSGVKSFTAVSWWATA